MFSVSHSVLWRRSWALISSQLGFCLGVHEFVNEDDIMKLDGFEKEIFAVVSWSRVRVYFIMNFADYIIISNSSLTVTDENNFT